MLVARSSALRGAAEGAESLLDVSGRLWAAGHQLLYQPDACAVRALPGDGGEAEELAEAWLQAVASRPERPESLDSAAWRVLLAHDDVEESWR
jgi:hypothetical protein